MGSWCWLSAPDGKSQVTFEYDENNKRFRVDAIVIPTQHAPEVKHRQLVNAIRAGKKAKSKANGHANGTSPLSMEAPPNRGGPSRGTWRAQEKAERLVR